MSKIKFHHFKNKTIFKNLHALTLDAPNNNRNIDGNEFNTNN